MMETLSSVSNLLVMPFWILMIFLPRWAWTRRLVTSPLIVVAPAVLYAALVLPRLGAIGPAVSRPTLDGIAQLLGTPEGATIAWLHFLAFDLFVGRWVYLDSRERSLSVWLIGPVLFLTLMFGPMGLLAYLAARTVAEKINHGEHGEKIGNHGEHREHGEKERGEFEMSKRVKEIFQGLAEVDRPLAVTALLYLLVLPIIGVALLLDPRQITGVPAWLKPAKFLFSTSIYAFTLLWMLRFVQGHPRIVRGIARVTAVGLAVEMVVIALQASRGMTSHFNISTPLDGALWSAMGFFIVLVWLANFATAILLLRSQIEDSAFAWSLRLGVLLTFMGMAVGFFMTTPTREQLAQPRVAPMRTVGAHTVGAPDGGPGLPVTNWSTRGGDLRIPHFVGLHALQILPFLGWLLSRRRAGKVPAALGEEHRVALIWTAGATYFGLIILLTWQALRGQPIVAPDSLTLSAFGALFVAVVGSVGVILWRAQQKAAPYTPMVSLRPE